MSKKLKTFGAVTIVTINRAFSGFYRMRYFFGGIIPLLLIWFWTGSILGLVNSPFVLISSWIWGKAIGRFSYWRETQKHQVVEVEMVFSQPIKGPGTVKNIWANKFAEEKKKKEDDMNA